MIGHLMASKRNQRRKFQNKSCIGKIRLSITEINKDRDLYPYLCKFCGYWHRGHKKINFTSIEKLYSYTKKQEKRIVINTFIQLNTILLKSQIDVWENEGGFIYI